MGAVRVSDKITWHRYVRFADIPAYLSAGWEWDQHETPLHAPHGCYAVIMTWTGDGEPVESQKQVENV
jgi:hypothetical protein